MAEFQSIVILTGAGISAESGIDTFRTKGGLWEKYKIEDVATPDAFVRDPKKVLDFYNMRRRAHKTVQPNAAHFALADLEAARPGTVTVVTQNIDPLHEMAGSQNLIHMHGEALKAWCTGCDVRSHWRDDLSLESVCPNCSAAGAMRPDVVWFGEMPYHMERIARALHEADLFISIGTSGHVYPASGFVALARRNGAHTVELNLEPSVGQSYFAEAHHGKATEVVPWYVEQLINAEKR
ncbi:MAG: NAD-dependent deacylase [Hyphomicrobium sp.]|nr:NAD-dependent deacylase [Hyphomicrobium sp.]